MAKIAINTFLPLSIFLVLDGDLKLGGKRAYASAAENIRLWPAAAATTAVRNVVEDSAGGGASSKKEEYFRMRDPKTGNWIPENHFEDVNVVELREKFLSKKQNL